MINKPASQSPVQWIGVALVLALAILVLAIAERLPAPHGDDLNFWGTSVQISQNGELVNPYIHDHSAFFGTNKTFNFLPFYFYVQGAWMHLFGPSAASMFYYQLSWAIIGATATAVVATRFGTNNITGGLAGFLWILPLLFQTGLRYELTFYGLMMVGLAILDWSTGRLLVGFGFLALASLTHVIAVAYALPLSIAILWVCRPKGHKIGQPEILPIAVAIILVALAAFLLFAWMIHGSFREFSHAFLAHVGIRKRSGNEILSMVGSDLLVLPGLVTLLPIVILSGTAVVLAIAKPRWFTHASMVLGIAGLTGIVLHALMYVHTVHVAGYGMLCLCLVVLLDHSESPMWIRKIGWASLIGAVLLSFLVSALITSGGRLPTPDEKAQIRRYVLSEKDNHRVSVDTVAAKWVMDYDFPPQIQSWEWRKAYPEFAPFHLSKEEPDEIWIVSAYSLLNYTDDAQKILAAEPRISILGKTLHPFLVNPWKIYIIKNGEVVTDLQ